jgi:hypothetical protein
MLATTLDLAIEKPGDVVVDRKTDRPRGGLPRLHDDLCGLAAAPGAPSHLDDQAERALLRAKVRPAETCVRLDDGGERDVRKVMALCDHLRAEEHGRPRGGKAAQHLGHLRAATTRLGVEAHTPKPGRRAGDRLLEATGAEALTRDVDRAT